MAAVGILSAQAGWWRRFAGFAAVMPFCETIDWFPEITGWQGRSEWDRICGG